MVLKVCRSTMMSFSKLLELIVYKIEYDVRSVYFCNHMMSLANGLTIVECDFDMTKLYDAAVRHGLIDVYVAHEAINLAAYYFKNIDPDFKNDMEKFQKYPSHKENFDFARRATYDDMLAWEAEESRSPPLRRSPSIPRVKGTQDLVARNLFQDFLHSESLDDPYEFSETDFLENLYGPGVVALDVGVGTSQPYFWTQDGVMKLTNVDNYLHPKEGMLEDGESTSKKYCGTSVHPRHGRRVSQMKKSPRLNFGRRGSTFRKHKVCSFFSCLRKHKGEKRHESTFLKWFLVDGRLEVNVIALDAKIFTRNQTMIPRYMIRESLIHCSLWSRLHAMIKTFPC